jgi:predicted SAM-dependent methyltransferase
MLKKLISIYLPQFAAFIKKNRLVKPDQNTVKLNLGSGLTIAPGWINIDMNFNTLVSKLPSPLLGLIYNYSGAQNWFSREEYIDKLTNNTFIHHKLEYGIPFEDNSIDFIYTSHFLEHVFRDEAEEILKESFRVLKPGGLIRVCIPDLEIAVDMYNNGHKEESLELFFTGKADFLSRHKYLYDFDMFKPILEKSGFKKVTKEEFQKGNMPDIQILDCRREVTLYVEAYK